MTYFINVTDHDGKIHQLEATVGFSLMEIIRDVGLDVEAICGGCCACATCHCYIQEDWISKIQSADDDEESMLDQALMFYSDYPVKFITEELNGINVTLAPKF